jgi:hypothetical protein
MRRESTGRKPEGLPGRENRVSGASCVGGWDPRSWLKDPTLWPCWFGASEGEDARFVWAPSGKRCGGWGKENRQEGVTGMRGGGVVEKGTRAGSHLVTQRHKSFASVVPSFAKTINLCCHSRDSVDCELR